MRLLRVTLQQFRNVPAATLALTGRQQFLVGANGQGKTNLLEAVGFITALRSFRTADQRLLIAHGQPEAALGIELEHEQQGRTQLTIKVRPGGKEVWVEATRMTRLADFIGHYPTVVFSSQDQQLIRGSPGARRRWLDLTLASTDPAYFQALQAYHRALADRNQLLKREAPDAEIAAFEHPLAEQGAWLVAARTRGLEQLGARLAEAYSLISDAAEPVAFAYAPDVAEPEVAALRRRLAEGRPRDRQVRSTQAGPHRDDFVFTLRARPARDVASEGQQRSLVLALRIAQADHVFRCRGVQPVLLADDVLGELDPDRRRRFWSALPADAQVLATGTSEPDTDLGAWQVFTVRAGSFHALGGGA